MEQKDIENLSKKVKRHMGIALKIDWTPNLARFWTYLRREVRSKIPTSLLWPSRNINVESNCPSKTKRMEIDLIVNTLNGVGFISQHAKCTFDFKGAFQIFRNRQGATYVHGTPCFRFQFQFQFQFQSFISYIFSFVLSTLWNCLKCCNYLETERERHVAQQKHVEIHCVLLG